MSRMAFPMSPGWGLREACSSPWCRSSPASPFLKSRRYDHSQATPAFDISSFIGKQTHDITQAHVKREC
eukprot:1387970-Amorphochlora_amoeboformis.AAC.1